ncbi:DUF438 domain-containing protein [Tetragenococcus muriaticus]|uniref:DUF438 domain-containing protein n=1 Tax=Tetragenococcus muriaticus 3MR10-3 TaxID=1302648 RepID=A0A091C6Z7_9ENTE|nr:DUF438 domain-containing protein [Tetragenococcus muriaticus]KFN92699.1 hypothetical protein TMU3MR103_0352 [Tetragenococcus muriaticus 3MR10-3]GMA45981.1 histidine kinase [Tetragenococcus muriaticus]GMA46071.1 histidine kinase [Tetragenococcus muriaticus]GMA46230.1 histidine kinase [Tetragenococcus muriaticus]
MARTKEERKQRIVEILSMLHEEGSFEEAKRLFNEEFDGVDVTEITAAEKSLIQGGLKAEEIQKLCNIHVSVFKGSINEIHNSEEAYGQSGHPVHTLKLENQVLQSLVTDEIDDLMKKIQNGDWQKKPRLTAAIEDLKQIDTHYTRKETLIFSYMEKYGITAPPQVMWGVDDEVRGLIKELLTYIKNPRAAFNPLFEKWEASKNEIEEMIFKEEEIMIPMTLDVFSLRDWENIAEDSYDIGFAYIPEPPLWKAGPSDYAKEKEREPQRQEAIQQAKETTEGIAEGLANEKTYEMEESYDWQNIESKDSVVLPTGILQLDQLLAIFEVLPVDLTFVDHNDHVRFFSEGKHRVFPRTKSIIGREVVNCHPPKSMHMVEKILEDFHAGINDTADFWFDINERKIYIRYFALKNSEDQYLGCLEVTQDITDIQKISGQNRLLEGFTKD